jgi:AbrB family looped-hinge helix DNA binding protein
MNTITLTSKGQVTLPVEIRKQMRLKEGDQLDVFYNPETQTLSVSKPMRAEDLSDKYGKLVRPRTKPVVNVDEYYQKHRQPRI